MFTLETPPPSWSTTISVCFFEVIKDREFRYALVNRRFALHLCLMDANFDHHSFQRVLASILACVAGVIEEGEGERGRREKMRGIGERERLPQEPHFIHSRNDFRLIKLPYPSITVISSTNQNQARVSLHD